MSFYLVQILNGVSFGMLLFLLAAGLSLIYGLMRILNLAHGSVDVKGRVVDIQSPREPDRPFHVGVDFVSVDDLDQALLQSFLERERRKAL